MPMTSAEVIESSDRDVVLQERYNKLLEAADSGDKYGLARISSIGSWKVR